MRQIMTREKSFYKELARIALPIALQNLITFGLNMLDTVMIGAVGESELAAVGQANQPFFVFTLFLFGIASGSCILISQYWGKGDKRTIGNIMGFSIMLATVVALLVTAAVMIFPKQIMKIFINDETVANIGVEYLMVVAPSYVLTAISTTYLSLIRATEQVSVPLKINLISLGTNALLNYIFIFGKLGVPAMGVRGAALATVIARMLELAIVIFLMTRRGAVIRLKWSDFIRMPKLLVKDFFKYSTPVIINETLWGLGISVYAMILGQLGPSAVASYNVVQVLEKLACVALFGISNATIILLGKKIGSGEYSNDTIMVYAKTTMVLSLACGIVFGGILILLRPVIFTIYQLPAETIELAKRMLLVTGSTLFLRSLSNISIVGILRSGGDSNFSLFVDTTGLWLVGIPFGLVSAFVFHASTVVVYASFAAEQFYKSVVCVIRVLSRKWIKNVTR